jgi:carboxypeptidase C (cathepsin A)
LNEYALALMQGAKLSDSERQKIVTQLARYTGLSPKFVEQNDLRIPLARFTKELMRDQRRTVGRLDSRFLGIDRDAAGEGFEYDPSYAAIYGPFSAMLNDYVRTELKSRKLTRRTRILTSRVRPWNYGSAQNRYVNVAETLRGAMSQETRTSGVRCRRLLRLQRRLLRRSGIHRRPSATGPALQKNIPLEHYHPAHMMYIHKPSTEKLTRDVTAFYQTAAPEK